MKDTKTQAISKTGALPLALILLASCSATDPIRPSSNVSSFVSREEGLPGGVVVDTVTVSAKVLSIDKTKRVAVLEGPDQKEISVIAGPEAVNFGQIEVGDMVNATLIRQAVAFMGDADSAKADGDSGVIALAPEGERPSGVVSGTIRRTGTVVAMDVQTRTATLRFEDGSTATFLVRPDVDMTARRVGETIVMQITEAVAIDISKP